MIRASSTLFWFGLAIIASLWFYRTTDNVLALEHQLRSINTATENEQQSIHVLKAEWVYLANPARIEAEARKHLAPAPAARQIVALELHQARLSLPAAGREAMLAAQYPDIPRIFREVPS